MLSKRFVKPHSKGNAAGLSPALAPNDYQIPIQGQGTRCSGGA